MDSTEEFDYLAFRSEWSKNLVKRTFVASMFGVVFGGVQGVSKGRDLALEHIAKLEVKPTIPEVKTRIFNINKKARSLFANTMSRYMAKGSLNYGMKMIGLAAAFTTLECGLHFARNNQKHNPINTIIAGTVTGTLVGPFLGSSLQRITHLITL